MNLIFPMSFLKGCTPSFLRFCIRMPYRRPWTSSLWLYFFLILKKLPAPFPYFKYKKQQSGVSGVSIVQSGLRVRKTGSGGMGAPLCRFWCCSALPLRKLRAQLTTLNCTLGNRCWNPVMAKLAAEKLSHSSVPRFLFGSSPLVACRVQGNSYHIHPQKLWCMSCILLSKG